MPPQDEWLSSRRFGVVIDAGSSGSRLQIYSWKDPRSASPSQARSLPLVEKGSRHPEDWQKKIEPGISSYSSDPRSVNKHLAPLLAHAREHIPPSVEPSTPLYLLATAGMRLLPLDVQTTLLEETCHFFQHHSHFILEPPSEAGPCGMSVRIISGEEEGLFGWIAVNYLLDGFMSGVHHHHSETYGFLDMGGASAQIAFEPDLPHRQKDHGLFDVHLRRLGGEEIHHQVFVTTWLGFGSNQARERYVSNVTAQHQPATEMDDPCLPRSLSSTETLHSSATQDVRLHGTGSFSQCLDATLPILNKSAQCEANQISTHKCMFDGVAIPPINFATSHFVGVSEYWYSSEQVFGLGGEWDYPRFERKAEEFCGREWAGLTEEFNVKFDYMSKEKKASEMERLKMQCFKAAWVANVLHEGLGMPRVVDLAEDTTTTKVTAPGEDPISMRKKPRFQSADSINDMSISWTLGKMVLEASKEVPIPRKSTTKVEPPLLTPPQGATEDRSGDGPLASPPLRYKAPDLGSALIIPYILTFLVAIYLLYRFRRPLRLLLRRLLRNGQQSSLRLEEGLGSARRPSLKPSPPSFSRISATPPANGSPTLSSSGYAALGHSSSRSSSPAPLQPDANGLANGQLTPRSRNSSQSNLISAVGSQPGTTFSASYYQGQSLATGKITRVSSTMSMKRED